MFAEKDLLSPLPKNGYTECIKSDGNIYMFPTLGLTTKLLGQQTALPP